MNNLVWKENFLNQKIEKKKSIARWSNGYYIDHGGPHGFNIPVPIFGFKEYTNLVGKVLVDYLGSMFWINIDLRWISFNYTKGTELRIILENLKS